ncbi:glutamate ABC transporter substrate-binding protein [Aeromicrobium sp. YIM 150415]|uniref:Glutamate ABC transporter substrate-binding protein n=1 Tax=Aeromicrobium piscarium TaxID=2590901 RepID=A0A554SG57_9ACTN|nr:MULTISPECIES: glutamate ABC transporter substrate-binding protein [Aeromicrobium]MBM9462699.1 glutamate ABC transporter substrate-binding protein [Aeromicrobium sp. YIM 150415]TSD65332.1 glutamate ABC transporter substrate-binding protein [Aeromicrobium piscarium]
MRSTTARLASIAAASMLALAACGDAGSDDETAPDTDYEVQDVSFDDGTRMAELNEQGTVKIGVKYDQPGIGFRAAGQDDPTGFDPEIGKIVAAHLGIEADDIEWVETISQNREQFLQNGTVDFVIASYSITDDRREVVGQAGPYYVTGQGLLVREDDDSINGPDDLEGKSVCSVTGSTPIKLIEEEYGADPAGFDTYSECVDQLLSGSVDAVTTDEAILLGYAAENEGELKVVGEPFSEERYGIGYSKDAPELCEFLNDTLTDAFDDGDWETAFDETLGKGGADAGTPPELDPCES